jgi:hypothetical protein
MDDYCREKEYEEIKSCPPVDGGEWLYAIVIRASYRKREPGIRFFTDPNHSQQLACMSYETGHVVPPHRHLLKKRTTIRTQELILVREGKIRVDVYNSDDELMGMRILEDGDAILLLDGGHALTALEPSQVMELKTGPYPGRELDKVELK